MRNENKKLPIKVLIPVLLGLAVLVVLVWPALSSGSSTSLSVAAVDASGSPIPSISPSTSPEPVPQASDATVKWAFAQRRLAHRAWVKYKHAARCFGKNVGDFGSRGPSSPVRAASETVWRTNGQGWQRLKRTYVKRFNAYRHKMLHPGGAASGTKWLPLASWVGWPGDTFSQLAYIIMRESTGRPDAYNGVIGCTGLLQIWPGNVPSADRHLLVDPEYNLTAGLRLYRSSGWGPWAL